MQLLAGDAVLVEQREHIVGVAKASAERGRRRSHASTSTSRSLATPTTVPGVRGASRRTTVPSADGSAPGSGDAVARA